MRGWAGVKATRWLGQLRARLAALNEQRSKSAVALESGPLWPFTPRARERCEQAIRAGTMTAREADQLLSFAENGYMIFERAIEPELLDALVTDVRRIGRHPGYFVTTDHRRGR